VSAPRLSDRWRLTLPLLLPSLGGLGYLWAYDAPLRLIAVNGGALCAGLLWVMCGRLPASSTTRLALAGLAALALTLPVILGPEVGRVSRWLPAGPVMLHSGPLLLPLIVVLAAREAHRVGAVLLAVAGAVLVLQPDAAALAALGCAGAVLAALSRSPAYAAVSLAALALAAATFGAGTLEPQLYTEGVLAHVAGRSLWQAGGLAALLFGALLWLGLAGPQSARRQAAPLAALLAAFGAMAVIAPFPFPLIGYGAAPILGFALALGALRQTGGESGADHV
jgi:hypothetical protein